MKLIFATNNQHKVDEIKHALQGEFEIITLAEAGIEIDIPEPHATLSENAREKARVIHQLTNENCFSEDTGLEVTALAGAPGVRSARYAGTGNSQDNIALLLHHLDGQQDRSAQFRTIICAIVNGEVFEFEGICPGRITYEQQGFNGFGYDPVFIPDGADVSFAEMSLDQKSAYSHRKKALDKFIAFLKGLHEQD